MEAASQSMGQIDRPPPTLFTLKKRAENDLPLFLDALHAFGYFDAYLAIEYTGTFPDVTITYILSAGPRYRFGPFQLLDPEGESVCICNPCALDLQAGCPVRFDTILDTEDQIKEQLGTQGYPFVRIPDREIIVDQEQKVVFVNYTIDTGPIATFGPVTILGLRKVAPSFVCKHIYWNYGDLYTPRKVDCTDRSLQESGMFSSVIVHHANQLGLDNSLEMIIELEETKYRHIGAGVSYSTDESVGALFQWIHDNLTGHGDSFSITTEISEIIQRGTAVYGRPNFFARNQNLTYSFELRRENTPGFVEREASFLMRVDRKVNEVISYDYAGRFEKLLSTKSDNNENYNLLSLPVHLRIDTSNNLLNSTRGYTINYWAAPYQALFNSHVFFYKQEIFGALYQPFFRNARIVLALSGQLGSIVGQSSFLIPAPKRFYAGSSTGLRGYKYLTVSPLSGTKPIGGRSLMIFQIEPRVRVYGQIYFATFFDIGNVYATPFPRLTEKLLRSTGCGVRYLTPVGAFRLDVGFPLDKRKGIDKTFQLYASIGQTF